MSKLYLDSANIEDIKFALTTDVFCGITTNPSLMAKESKGNYLDKLLEIKDVITKANNKLHLSVEVIETDYNKMIESAIDINKSLKDHRIDLYVKIPLTFNTLPVISKLENCHVKVNATACMTAIQAKLAHDAGAHKVSFFYRRMLDAGIDAKNEINKFRHIRTNDVDIICGSIRHVDDVSDCWWAGADIVTASMKIVKEMAYHAKTEEAIAKFEADINTWLK